MEPAVRKKRRWWFYAIWIVVGLLLVAGVLVVLGVRYWNSAIRTYTTTQSVVVPAIENPAAKQEQLKAKWSAFRKDIEADRPPPPLRLTADDLNVFLSNLPGMSNRVHLVITNDQLQAHFSVPLDRSGQKQLRGRHLNGVATLRLSLQDGWPVLNVASLDANGQPIPRWLQGRIGRQNFFKDIHRDMDTMEFVQRLDNIEVKDGAVIFTPYVVQPAE